MKNCTWETVIRNALSGNEAPFNQHVNDMYVKYHFAAIQKLTKNEQLTREVYTCAITKFWERFVIKGESIPHSNVNGYIYNMARNAFVDLKRKKKKTKESLFNTEYALDLVTEYRVYVNLEESNNREAYYKEQNKHDSQLKLLHESIKELDDKCQSIIRRNVYEGELLKDLKSELGIKGTYQSIVEKKKRCMRRLSKLMFHALESIGQKSKLSV